MNTREHPLYGTWLGMVSRCHNSKHKGFSRYGARGISVCQSWRESLPCFAEYVGPRPSGRTLDRIDNDGNYEPGNVRWATYAEQRANSSSAPLRYLTFGGRTQLMTEWAREIGISTQLLHKRLDYMGWPIEKALRPTPDNLHKLWLAASARVAEVERENAILRRLLVEGRR